MGSIYRTSICPAAPIRQTFSDSTDTRPRLEPLDDELDMLGRPKRRMVRMPTEVLPEGVEPEHVPLAGFIIAADEEAEMPTSSSSAAVRPK